MNSLSGDLRVVVYSSLGIEYLSATATILELFLLVLLHDWQSLGDNFEFRGRQLYGSLITSEAFSLIQLLNAEPFEMLYGLQSCSCSDTISMPK